jgi:hypothetical protein
VEGQVNFEQNVNINDGLQVNGLLIVNGGITVLSTTASTSTTTGAITVVGGAGIGGQVNAASFNATSDYRIKENITSLDGTFTVNNLRPVHFYNKILNKSDIGVVAHELQEQYPFLVNGEKDGIENQTVNYSGLIGILINEIQNMKKEIAQLHKEVDELKNK